MKIMKIILLLIIFCSKGYSQNIAYVRMREIDKGRFAKYNDNRYLDNAIIEALEELGLNIRTINNTGLFSRVNNQITTLNTNQVANLKMFNYDYIILHNSGIDRLGFITEDSKLVKGQNHKLDFVVFDVRNNQSIVVNLTIATFDCGDKLRPCSNLEQFTKTVKDFVQRNNSSESNRIEFTTAENTPLYQDSKSSPILEQSFLGNNKNSKIKLKIVRVKERISSNHQPVSIDVYDKTLNLKIGDNLIITRTDEVKIPGERKIVKSETTIGKAKITEDFNKPLYTAKLIANAGYNMKDYKDGLENYNAVKGETNITVIATPKIMVIPKKIDPSKYVNGEYLLSKEEKMLIAAFKNKFEDNKFTTYGFESNLKTVLENRQFNSNIQDDIKSKILESSGMDFFVEYENLDQNNSKCDKVFDFKIRNYSTGEDVASDIQSLNSCGTPNDYKNFASTILNSGAVSKINSQFSSLLNNGRKVSVIFTILNSTQSNLNKEFNGIKLKDHIENCLQGLAYNGNLDIEGVVNLRMETTVNIPIINDNTGKSYTTNTFSEDIISYLKKNANVICESTVSKQIVNILIK